jgi:hypothetical protein
MEKDAKIIFSPQLANFLLKKGFQIIKLKPRHGKEEESVYVFETKEGFFEAVEEWNTQKA